VVDVAETGMWVLELAVLIFLAKILEGYSRRINTPRIVFFVLLGVTLAFIRYYTGYALSDVLEAFATLGIVALLFLAGLEGSLKYFMRGLKDAGIIALGGVLAAVGFGLSTIILLGLDFGKALAIGIILSATSVSVTVDTLSEMNKLNTKEAMLIIEAAVVDDVLGLILLSFLGAYKNGLDIFSLTVVPVSAFIVWYLTAWFSNKYMGSILKAIGRLNVLYGLESVSLAILLLFAFLGHSLGLSYILLAYAYGIGLASNRYFARKAYSATSLIAAIFAPLFFIYVGYKLDVEYLYSVNLLSIAYVLTIVTILGFLSKFVGCYLSARLVGLNHKSATVIGVGMIPRSEVAMVATALAYDLGLIKADLFAASLVMILSTVLVTPILLKKVF
jgi:Kef-type K+ transport system membrane component KefB